MPPRQPIRDDAKPRPDHRRGMFIVALVFGALFAYARTERETMYVVPGFSLGLAPFALAPDGEAATDAGAAMITTLETMESHVVSSRFRHVTEVDEDLGIYDFDSSGLVGWVLQRAAPVAYAALGRERPVAEDFARAIHAAPADEDTDGWRQLSHPSALRLGDIIAWSTPLDHREDGITGHAAIVVGMPVRVPGMDEAWSVRVADATNEYHQWDTRLLALDMDGGVGRGTITLAVGEDGHAYAYGWQGPWSPMFLRTDVELGRVTR